MVVWYIAGKICDSHQQPAIETRECVCMIWEHLTTRQFHHARHRRRHPLPPRRHARHRQLCVWMCLDGRSSAKSGTDFHAHCWHFSLAAYWRIGTTNWCKSGGCSGFLGPKRQSTRVVCRGKWCADWWAWRLRVDCDRVAAISLLPPTGRWLRTNRAFLRQGEGCWVPKGAGGYLAVVGGGGWIVVGGGGVLVGAVPSPFLSCRLLVNLQRTLVCQYR